MKHALLGLSLAFACGGSQPSPASHEPSADTVAGKSVEMPDADEILREQIAAITAAVNDYSGAIHTCWAVGAADDFRLEGKVVLSVEIGAEGATTAVSVLGDEPGDAALTACLKELWSDHRWPSVFAAGDSIQLPPFNFVAPDAQYTVAEAHARSFPLGKTGSAVKVLLDSANSGNASASMSIFDLKGGIEVPMHRHSSAELLFVFSGAGTLYGLGGVAKGRELASGDAIYIPANTAHGFVHTGTEPMVALQLYAPGGPEARFKGGPATGTTPVTAKEQKRVPRRFSRPRVRSVKDSEPLAIAGGKGDVRILFDKGLAKDGAAYLGALTAQPGLVVPAHKHAVESEYLFLVEGEGSMVVAGDSFPVQAGDAIQIPPGVEHSFTASGETAVKAVQFYTPSGPEQRFKAGK